MKILVTGVNGAVGGNIYRYLFEKYEDDVEGISRKKYSSASKNKGQITHVEDFLNPKKDSLFYSQYDIIVHAAAITPKFAKSKSDFKKNILISKCFIKKLSLFKGKFIHLSSASVYEASIYPLNEKSTLTIKDEYGISMYESEDIFKKYISNVLILRIFYPYGFDSFTKKDNLVDKLLVRIIKNQPLTVNSLYKDVFINPLNLIVETFINNNIKSGTFNLAGPDQIKLYHFITFLFKKTKIIENKESILIDDLMPIPHSAEIKKLYSIVAKQALTNFQKGLNNIKL